MAVKRKNKAAKAKTKTNKTKAKKFKSAKSKLSPKVGTSKKAASKKASKAKKQVARKKASSALNKMNKLAIKEKQAKAKKGKKELKKPKTIAKKLKKAKNHAERPARTNQVLEIKSRFVSPNDLESTGETPLLPNQNEAEPPAYSELNPQPGHAEGKKHMNLEQFRGKNEHDETKLKQLQARPEAFNKRGRSTSPRATFPTR